jgi:hypothetical protein
MPTDRHSDEEKLMKHFLTGTVAAICFAAGISSAIAAPITGSINLYGDFQPMIGGSNTQDLSLANKIDFVPLGGTTGTFSTGTGTGNLALFANQNDTGIIKDFTFNPFSSMNSFYTITVGASTLTFDLTGLSIVNQNTTFLTLSGTGLLHETGFDNTAGNWNFSGQSSNSNTAQATFSWSAGSEASPPTGVPEPASMALTGLGMLGVGFLRRRKTAQVTV